MFVELGRPVSFDSVERYGEPKYYMHVKVDAGGAAQAVSLSENEFNYLLGLMQNPTVHLSDTPTWVVVHRSDDLDFERVMSSAYKLANITYLGTTQTPIPTEQ